MKSKQFTTIFLSAFFLMSSVVYADWSLTLHAKGQNKDGLHKASVTIGEGNQLVAEPAPPRAPVFSCAMEIISNDWESRFSKYVTDTMDVYTNEWVVAINPSGNANQFEEATTQINWDASHLGEGIFEIRQGFNGDGDVIVDNMKTTDGFSVTGQNEDYFFTIIKK